jgi:DNA mismatch repair protein MutL
VNRIQVLSPLVAERIAAGEVVERPSSVVKELVENAIDAGATEITVRLEDGGKALIEVLDNGLGMSPEDLKLAVVRHATSKIREVSDLESLASLGFRGEALPSISACAELSILSREKDADHAYEWRESGVSAATFGSFHAAKHGTRIQVRSLFSQIPARLKFLKAASTEVSAVREWLERLALTHPEITFKLESLTAGLSGSATQARVVFHARAESESARVARILGDENDYPVITEETVEAGAIRIRAHWLQGATSPQMRKVVQVVNGRAVRDRLIQQAVLVPFRQALLPGQFPAIALYLELPPALIDVNVHPAKTELRFLNGSQIFRAVERLVENMIGRHGVMGFATGGAGASQTDCEDASRIQAPAGGFGFGSIFSLSSSSPSGVSVSESAPVSGDHPRFQQSFTHTAFQSPSRFFEARPTEMASSTDSSGMTVEAPSAFEEKPRHPFTADRYSGALFQTYLLYDFGSELALVDQHAAHERIRFEKLRRRALAAGSGAASQALLIPEVAKFPAEDRTKVESRLPLLEALGFEAELFGGNGDDEQLLFRSVPAEWGTANLRTRLFTLVEKLRALEETDLPRADAEKILKLDERLFEKLASEACHSAVRAGDRLDAGVAHSIVEELFACEHPWNCPHGRPTIARVPRARFEEWFQRRV